MYIYNTLVISLNRNRNAYFMFDKTSLTSPGIKVFPFDLVHCIADVGRNQVIQIPVSLIRHPHIIILKKIISTG